MCEVRFTEWTGEGGLRHPIFLGMRTDKPPTDVRREDGADPEPEAAPVEDAAAEEAPREAPGAGAARTKRSATDAPRIVRLSISRRCFGPTRATPRAT